MNQEMSFIMHTPEGDVSMNVLFTFESPETKAFYMLYTPDPLDSPPPGAPQRLPVRPQRSHQDHAPAGRE